MTDETATANEATDRAETVLIMNPHSGSGDHAPAVRELASRLGYRLRETQYEDHAVDLAQAAAEEGASHVVAVGGDGTLNEVVRGVCAADALEEITVGVVPAGTGNDFAGNVGITDIEQAFDVLENGELRRLDVGVADGRPFVNSCIAGITAAASGEASSDLKARYGGLAYVLTTVKTATEFDGLDLTASVGEGTDCEPVWKGEAAVVLAGNGRRFSMAGSEQADVEDGLLDVTIIEETSSVELAEDRLRERLLHEEGDHVTRLLASSLELSVKDGPATFSLDGEMVEFESVTLRTRSRAMAMRVGSGYDPRPEED